MQPQVKQRNSNLELYRIIVMLLIVAHHYVVNSGMMEEMARDPLSSRSLFFTSLECGERLVLTVLC